jgi:hypothetical protein
MLNATSLRYIAIFVRRFFADNLKYKEAKYYFLSVFSKAYTQREVIDKITYLPSGVFGKGLIFLIVKFVNY